MKTGHYALNEEEIYDLLNRSGWNPRWKWNDYGQELPMMAAESPFEYGPIQGDSVSMPLDLLKMNPEISVEVQEDSLEMLGIGYGDRVVLRLFDKCNDGDVVLVNNNGIKLMVYYGDDDGEWLVSPDSNRPAIPLNAEMKRNVIGRVLESRKRSISMPLRKINQLLKEHRDEWRQMVMGNQEPGKVGQNGPKLNYTAPKQTLQEVMRQKWIDGLLTDKSTYHVGWRTTMVEELMKSDHGRQIAENWAVRERRAMMKCWLVGALKDVQVLSGSYNKVAKLIDVGKDLPAASLAKYMGEGKKQPFFEWLKDYVKNGQMK